MISHASLSRQDLAERGSSLFTNFSTCLACLTKFGAITIWRDLRLGCPVKLAFPLI
jgi:hypothetical protein